MRVMHDHKFYLRLMVQGTCAIVFMYFVLYFLDFIRAGNLIWAAGASTLASTCFIVFGTPNIDSAKPHRIFIGYLIAIFCGHFIRVLSDSICGGLSLCFDPEQMIRVHEVAAIIALALAFVLMVMLRSSHPPAAGLSVVMVIDITSIAAMVVIGVSAAVLAIIMLFFKRYLRPLI